MNHIDLSTAINVLNECVLIAHDCDGAELDDSEAAAATNGRSKADVRAERAERSRALHLLADRCELVSALVRNEYWTARGNTDHLHNLTIDSRD